MVKCDICGKEFKTKAGLAGHKQLSHYYKAKKTYPDEIGRRLEAVEKNLHKLATAWADTAKQLAKNDNEIMEALAACMKAVRERYG